MFWGQLTVRENKKDVVSLKQLVMCSLQLVKSCACRDGICRGSIGLRMSKKNISPFENGINGTET